jgi:spore coat polysaccharide biosynthesis protein SpsF
MAVEVVSRSALAAADLEARQPAEREHVTPFIYWQPERFRLASMTLADDHSGHRWTVDTIEDFELVSKLLTQLHPKQPQFRMHDVLALLDEHPAWVRINQHVAQKSIAPMNKEKQ